MTEELKFKTLEEFGGKYMFELTEGDLIRLVDTGEIVIFIEVKRSKFVWLSKTGNRMMSNKTNYDKYIGEDKNHKEMLAAEKSNDLEITQLEKGDVFGYYNGGKLKGEVWRVLEIGPKYILADNLVNGTKTKFTKDFTVRKIDLSKFIK